MTGRNGYFRLGMAEEFQRIAQGERSAMEQLFRQWYAPLCAFAVGYLKDSDKAEDLVQELFIRLWEDRARLEVHTSAKSYLYAAVRNRCLNALAANKRTVRLSPAHEPIEENGSPAEEVLTERAARVRAAVEALPPERRKVFTLSRYEGLKYQEIADRLGSSVKTVENQMGSALRTLRTDLVDLLPVLGWLLWISDKVE